MPIIVMTEPLVLIPGLSCDASALCAAMAGARAGAADPRRRACRDESLGAIAQRLLAAAPGAFCALRPVDGRLCRLRGHAAGAGARDAAGPARHQRQAGDAGDQRAARADDRAGGEGRLRQRHDAALAEAGRAGAADRRAVASAGARGWRRKSGADGFIRQQRAIMGRPDSRPGLAAITRSDAGAGR